MRTGPDQSFRAYASASPFISVKTGVNNLYPSNLMVLPLQKGGVGDGDGIWTDRCGGHGALKAADAVVGKNWTIWTLMGSICCSRIRNVIRSSLERIRAKPSF